ncbi:hypothetical protein NMY22_g1260 [Coprinellus aureogranulatus]|nr:hypothetical protein NMY22_g1260 [Coprinellus aureogranulatus]
MSLSKEQVQSMINAVSRWRMQEVSPPSNDPCILANLRADKYTEISFTTLYVHYVLTTVDEEVSVIHPQKWRQGKVLFMFIRYAPFINIALKLVRDYRNYYTISAWACKVLKAYEVPYLLTTLACAVAFGFCLSALIGANKIVTILIVILAAGNNLVAFVFALISLPQYPGGSHWTPLPHETNASHFLSRAPSTLLVELGYPCYIPSSAEVAQATILDLGLDIRRYVAFATAIVTLMLAIAALATRYKGHHGPLVQIVRNDVGIYCIAVAADYIGSEPAASKLLFAPPPLTSEDNDLALTRDKDILEIPSPSTDTTHPAIGSVSNAHTVVENA